MTLLEARVIGTDQAQTSMAHQTCKTPRVGELTGWGRLT